MPEIFALCLHHAYSPNVWHNENTTEQTINKFNLLTTTLALRFQAKGGVFIAGGGVMTKLLPSILDIPGRSFNKKAEKSIGGERSDAASANSSSNSPYMPYGTAGIARDATKHGTSAAPLPLLPLGQVLRQAYLAKPPQSRECYASKVPLYIVSVSGDDLAMIGAHHRGRRIWSLESPRS